MDPRSPSHDVEAHAVSFVSNLTPVFDDGGGGYHAQRASQVFERHAPMAAAAPAAVAAPPAAAAPAPMPLPAPAQPSSVVIPSMPAPLPPAAPAPAAMAPAATAPASSALVVPEQRFSYETLADAVDVAPVEQPPVDYDALRRRDISREVLRARLIAFAEQREHRSAYEIVFIMLAAAVAILLAAPPLVQILLAARGVQT